jgi:hypothetical protein
VGKGRGHQSERSQRSKRAAWRDEPHLRNQKMKELQEGSMIKNAKRHLEINAKGGPALLRLWEGLRE